MPKSQENTMYYTREELVSFHSGYQEFDIPIMLQSSIPLEDLSSNSKAQQWLGNIFLVKYRVLKLSSSLLSAIFQQPQLILGI